MKKLDSELFKNMLPLHKEYIYSGYKNGKKLLLDEVSISDCLLKNEVFENAYMSDVLFENIIFSDCSFYFAKIYNCTFKNVKFINCDFIKLDFKYCAVDKCEYENSKLFRIDSYATTYVDCIFSYCEMFDCFGYTKIKNIKFNNINLTKFNFFETIIDNLEFNNCVNFDSKSICQSINKGTFENEIIITSSEAELYFFDNIKNQITEALI